MEEKRMKALKLIVTGKVQGVFYRAQTQNQAKQLGIMGSVKNLPDGNVEVVAEGELESMIQFVNWCHRGPLLAKVDKVFTEELPVTGLKEFKIER
jgi:acylphosphatase